MRTITIYNQQILKLNNKTYLPYLIHTLPNYFHKINLKYILKLNTTIYICSTQIKNKKQYINLLNTSNINKNNIK